MFGWFCNLIALFISTLFNNTKFYDSKDVNMRCFYCLEGGRKVLNRWSVLTVLDLVKRGKTTDGPGHS